MIVETVARSLKSLTTAKNVVRLNLLGNGVCARPQFVHKVSF